MKTMPTILPKAASEDSVQQQHHSSIVLQATIWKMCKGVEERASLMFLLNVSIHPHSRYDKAMWIAFKDWMGRRKNITRRVKWIKVFLILQYSHPHFPLLWGFTLLCGKIYDTLYHTIFPPYIQISLNLPVSAMETFQFHVV